MPNSEVLLLDIQSDNNYSNYIKWSILWWKWLLSIPKTQNPAFDNVGSYAYKNQNNSELFFLCQTVESSKTIPKRNIQILKGKKIFLPVINWISIKDNADQSDGELIKVAKEKMDKVGRLDLFVNNKPLNIDLTQYRVQSPIFQTMIEADNVVNASPGFTTLVSDGYWVCLEPLSDKLHLKSYGSCSLGITEIKVNYDITMVDYMDYNKINFD